MVHSLVPIYAALARPQMRVAIAIIVVNVSRANAIFEQLERRVHSAHQVRVTSIEADAEVRIAQHSQQFAQFLSGGKIVRCVLNEQRDSERPSKSPQMLYRTQGILEF